MAFHGNGNVGHSQTEPLLPRSLPPEALWGGEAPRWQLPLTPKHSGWANPRGVRLDPEGCSHSRGDGYLDTALMDTWVPP